VSTYRILAEFKAEGIPHSVALDVPAIGPDHARLIVLNSVMRLFVGVMDIRAEVIA
jgi:hypothetical protein